MVEVKLVGLGKRYGPVTAVHKVDLTVRDKEYVTILGPSGCGKTTLIRMIAGIIEPTEGKVFIDGKDMTGVPIEDRYIGYVFQNIALFPHLTVQDNVSYGPRARDMPREDQMRISKRFLDMVKLLDKMGMLPGELCGGEQQKASLARALSSGSKLLLLDEPRRRRRLTRARRTEQDHVLLPAREPLVEFLDRLRLITRRLVVGDDLELPVAALDLAHRAVLRMREDGLFCCESHVSRVRRFRHRLSTSSFRPQTEIVTVRL